MAKKSYKMILEELAQWEAHELMEQHSIHELKGLKKKFEKHRKELISALHEKEKRCDIK